MRCRLMCITVLACFFLWNEGIRAQTPVGASGLLQRARGASEVVQLIGINDAGVFQFQEKSKLELPADQVWRFGADRAAIRGPMLLLRDGSRYAAPTIATEKEEVVLPADDFHPALWDGWRFAITDVQAILFKPPHGKAALAELLTLFKPVMVDLLQLDNGDEVQGAFRRIDNDEILFAVRDRESRIPVARAISLRLAERGTTTSSPPREAWTLAFADGSRVRAIKPVFDAKAVNWKSLTEQPRSVNASEFWKQLILVEPPQLNTVYLGDLKEQGYRHLPTFGEPVAWGPNRSAIGEPLRHKGGYYGKGVGMWSNSRLSFDVPKGATQFAAEICIDDAADDGGSVVFRVLAQVTGSNGSELKDLYKSDVMRGGDASREVNVSLTGVTSVILLVEAADQGDALDLADWLDARMVLEPASTK